MTDAGLDKLGYGEWVRDNDACGTDGGFSPARVIEVNKNRYVVADGSREIPAELSGRFMFGAADSTDLPTVGDWVKIQAADDYTLAIVHSVLPRRALLKRKEPGKRTGYQLIAANIDFGLVVQSAERVNFNLLDRYFVMLNESRIQPIAVFNKIDLLSPPELESLRSSLSNVKAPHLLISTVDNGGVEVLSKELIAGKTYCLLGQSGVGKTSLLNSLLHTRALRVNEVREKDGRGRHTTVRRQLIRLDSGSIFIDTPGMRELGNFDVKDGMDQTFDEFSSYASKCRFRNCTHVHEQGCAVIEAVGSGAIEESRYQNYLKLTRETAFYEMSYQEKRRKDKSFGKMVKNYHKSKGRS